MNVKFEFIPGKMDTHQCNGELVLLEKDRLEILSNGNLFAENDGLVQIYDQGFCVQKSLLAELVVLEILSLHLCCFVLCYDMLLNAMPC